MTSEASQPGSPLQRWAWITHALLAGMLALSAALILFSGIETTDIQSSTGVAWSQIEAGQPTVARYIERLVRLLGVSSFGLASFAVAISLTGFRAGQRSAWLNMWVAPLSYGLIAAVMFVFASPIGYFYLAIATLQVLIQIGSAGRFAGQTL